MLRSQFSMLSKVLIFILRPFAGLARYGALKIMKWFRAPDDKRPAIAAAEHVLQEMVLPSVFGVFRETKFRELARFGKLPVSEHDRIFNELEVAGVGSALLCLRAAKSLVKPGDYHFWQETENQLPRQLQKILIGYGVDGSNAKLLKQLIDMRCEEYENLAEKISDANDVSGAEFKTLSPEMKWFAGMMRAFAIGAADHMRRGKMEAKDPLIGYLAEWLLFLQRQIIRFIKNL